MQDVTAILVTYNSADVIGAALDCLKREARIGQVIVVDNASIDDTCAVAARHCPDAVLIRSEKNLGFGAGNNLALERVKTAFALLVNPDALLREGALAALLEAACRYPDAGILAPQ